MPLGSPVFYTQSGLTQDLDGLDVNLDKLIAATTGVAGDRRARVRRMSRTTALCIFEGTAVTTWRSATKPQRVPKVRAMTGAPGRDASASEP